MGKVARPARAENRERLRKLCAAHGISLVEAARLLDRNPNTLHRWMTKSLGQPPPDELVELLEYRLSRRSNKQPAAETA